MANENTVRVHFIDGSEKIVPAKDIQWVGEEGARRATALVDGREVPIYKRSEPEWGPLWYEQEVSKDTFLWRALEEIDGFDGVLLPQNFYNSGSNKSTLELAPVAGPGKRACHRCRCIEIG